jgi:transcription antitermination factor NusG
VPAAVIEELLALEAARAALPEGASLEVVAGPFAGFVGRLQRLDGASRVTVLLQIIGAERAVSIDRTAVRRVG